MLVGRLQIFNNWSPYLVADPAKVWLGLEYFCYETDELWKLSDDDMIAAGASAKWRRSASSSADDVLDAHVIRMPKTYPAYFGTYDRFDEIRRLHGPLREPLPGGPQRHAQVQQPGPLHADGHDGGGQHRRRQSTTRPTSGPINTEQEYHEEKGKKRRSRPLLLLHYAKSSRWSAQNFPCDHREHRREAQYASRSDRPTRSRPVRQDILLPPSSYSRTPPRI